MIDRQLKDAFRKTARSADGWLQGCCCGNKGTGGIGGVAYLRILSKSWRKCIPQPYRSSCIIFWKKKKLRERARHIDQWGFRAQLSFSSPLKCQYGKQWEERGFNRMYAELTGNEVMTRGALPLAFVCFCLQIYTAHSQPVSYVCTGVFCLIQNARSTF